MARYFLNILDGEEAFDNVGTVLNNTNEVRLHMLAVANSWIEDGEHQDQNWVVQARDED